MVLRGQSPRFSSLIGLQLRLWATQHPTDAISFSDAMTCSNFISIVQLGENLASEVFAIRLIQLDLQQCQRIHRVAEH